MTAVEEPCWCCGNAMPDDLLLHLGDHPEVAVCLDCTTFLRQRAGARRDELQPGAGRRAREVVRAVRGQVIERQVHRWPVVGPLLQRLDRRLP